MRICEDIKSVRTQIGRFKKRHKSIGFVPTMGYLHEGHLSLIRKAKRDTDCVVVSIFVNPIQFGPKEDFEEYPRDFKRDSELCKRCGVDIIFAPSQEEMYREDFSTYVDVEKLTAGLCSALRPGHFRGVTTVVTKLFNIIKPDVAYFGQKDAQQALVIKRMARDLDMDIEINIMPIVREKDGLAMSSRNIYLSPVERKEALSLYKSLQIAKAMHKKGENSTEKIIKNMRALILKEKHAEIDYISIVDLENLKDVEKIVKKALVAVSVRIGSTRLIDNIILN